MKNVEISTIYSTNRKCEIINILLGQPKGMGASWKTNRLSGNSITIGVKKMWRQDVKWISFKIRLVVEKNIFSDQVRNYQLLKRILPQSELRMSYSQYVPRNIWHHFFYQ